MRRRVRGTPLSAEQEALKKAAYDVIKDNINPRRSDWVEAATKFNESLLEDQYPSNALSLKPSMIARDWID